MAIATDIFCWKDVNSFCIAKATHIFAAKISMYIVFENTLDTAVNKFVFNELFKLMMLWTTGSWSFNY